MGVALLEAGPAPRGVSLAQSAPLPHTPTQGPLPQLPQLPQLLLGRLQRASAGREEMSLPCGHPGFDGPGWLALVGRARGPWLEEWPRGEGAGSACGPALCPHCSQGLALTHVLEQNLRPGAGPRPEAATVVVLVTDGKSQDDARTVGQVLKGLGVDVFTVGE